MQDVVKSCKNQFTFVRDDASGAPGECNEQDVKRFVCRRGFWKKKHLRAIQIIYFQIKIFISSGMLTWVSKWSLIGLEWS